MNGTDKYSKQYDFNGRELSAIQVLNNPICTANSYTKLVTFCYYYPFTHKLRSVTQSINGEPHRSIADYTYDDLGRIFTKTIGGIEYQKYSYNIRGSLIGINGKFAETGNDEGHPVTFGEALKYDGGFTNNLLSGGLSGIIWKDKGYPSRAYGYTYDKAGRLRQADFREYCNSGSGTINWNNQITDFTEGSYQYDKNGNITSLKRYGPIVSSTYTGPGIIDDLNYIYESGGVSNRIQEVKDLVNSATTTYTPFDFEDSYSGVDYGYDPSGCLNADANKGISIVNNKQKKPSLITFASGSSIQNVYDYEGTKIEEIYTDASAVSKTKIYIGSATYVDNSLHQVCHSEGYTVPTPTTFNYFYFVKDHLGNVRNVQNAVEVPFSWDYHAGHELNTAAAEGAVFGKIPEVRDPKPMTTSQLDLMSARLNAADVDRITGTTIVLKVMPGDQFGISAETFYSSSDSATGTIDATAITESLIATLAGTGLNIANGEHGKLKTLNDLFVPGNIGTIDELPINQLDESAPRSFINYVLYDENFKIIPEESGRIQMGSLSDAWNAIGTGDNIIVKNGGYLVVFVSTSTIGVSSFFDHINIKHYAGSIQDINHYYPYGLTTTLSTTFNPLMPLLGNPLENQYLYQSKEYDKREGLYLYDFHAREYDPQLGRFASLDPQRQCASGYTGMCNNPALTVDPDGQMGQILAGAIIGGCINVALHWKSISGHGWEGVSNAMGAFAVGAGAGAVFAATGGVVAGAIGTWGGTSAVAAGLTGAAAAGAGYIMSDPLLQFGNHVTLGDGYQTPGQYGVGLAWAVGGGYIWGTISYLTLRMPKFAPAPENANSNVNAPPDVVVEANSTESGSFVSSSGDVTPTTEQGSAPAAVNEIVSIDNGTGKMTQQEILSVRPVLKEATILTEEAKYSNLVKAAQKLYPKKAGKIQFHHIEPQYLGGPVDGPLAPLDAAYHQVITNEFRSLWPYGTGTVPSATELNSIMQQVYNICPLPPGYQY